jgi:DNA polymerase
MAAGLGRSDLLWFWASVAGGDLLVPARRVDTPATMPRAAGHAEQDVTAPSPPPRSAPPATPVDVVAELARLAAEARACQQCRLHSGRRQAVFHDGSPRAQVMFVGEAPGHDEDVQGKPFVGRAGQLLTDIIQKAMGMARRDVYICNVVKCRPPENRNPEPDEQKACGHFLEAQIRLIRPRVIVVLGKVAAHYLLDTDAPMGRLRGRRHDYEGIPVIPTWHPAYLLRNPAAKQETWDDVRLVLRTLGLDDRPPPWREPAVAGA